MAKAFTLVLLLAAGAAIAAANDNNATTIRLKSPLDDVATVLRGVQHAGQAIAGITKDVSISVNDLGASLQDAQKIHSGDLSGCDCKKECKDETREVCKVTKGEKEVCKDVDGEKDFLECATKCYKADHVLEINVPTIDLSSHNGQRRRRLLEVDPVTTAVQAHNQLSEAHDALTGALTGGSGGSGSGGDGSGQKEVCREVCKPGKRPVTKQVCEKVPDNKYDCKDEILSTSCVTNCKCGDKISVQIKEVPDYLAAAVAATAHHPIVGPAVAVGAATLNAVNSVLP